MSQNATQDFHIAIVGAGIAGLALAISLHNNSIPFTLYEGAKEYSAVGAGIGFAPNGLRAMDLIEPRFRAEYEKICVGNKPSDAQNVFFEGLLIEPGLGMDQPWYGKSSWGHPNYTRKSAHRKALLDVMTKYIPLEKVKFSKRLTNIEQFPNKVTLTFEDGDTAEASLLIGADGIKSLVRDHVLRPSHPEQVEAVYANAYCYRSVIPIEDAQEILGDMTDVAKFYFGHKRSVVTYRISGGEEFNFLHCVSDPSPWPLRHEVTQQVSHEEMMQDFAESDIDLRVRKLLGAAKPVKWGLFHHASTSTYFRDRVIIMGDSAHASLPFQAAGAAQGVEDAVVLSSVLQKLYRDGCDADAMSIGLEAYNAVRRPRAQRQLEESYEVCKMIMFEHEECGDDMNAILKKLQGDRFEWLWFHDIQDDVKSVVAAMNEGSTTKSQII